MTLSPDFREFVALLTEREARFLVVGGYAVAHHGHPRYTGDLDVWIDRSPENAARVADALTAFGFGSAGLTAGDFAEADRVVQLGYPPGRLDILTSAEGVTFDECWKRRDVAVLDELAVPFISLSDLRVNKRALGRHQDLADLDNLEET